MKTRPVSIQGGGNAVQVVAICTLTGKKSKKVQLEVGWYVDGVQTVVKLRKKKKFFELKELEEGFKAGTTVSIQDFDGINSLYVAYYIYVQILKYFILILNYNLLQ